MLIWGFHPAKCLHKQLFLPFFISSVSLIHKNRKHSSIVMSYRSVWTTSVLAWNLYLIIIINIFIIDHKMLGKFPFPITPHLRLLYIMNNELTKTCRFQSKYCIFHRLNKLNIACKILPKQTTAVLARIILRYFFSLGVAILKYH